MKNLKIGTQIKLGFGAAIALMLVISVFVFIVNAQTLSNVEKIDEESNLQTYSNASMTAFMEAKARAELLYEIISPETSDEFRTCAQQTRAGFESALQYIDQNPALEQFRPTLETAEAEVSAFFTNMDSVMESDAQCSALIDQLNATEEELNGIVDLQYQEQFENFTNDVEAGSDAATILARGQRVDDAKNITVGIMDFSAKAGQLLDQVDAALAQDAYDAIDQVLADLAVYRDESLIQQNIDSAQKAIDIITQYRADLVSFTEAVEVSDEAIAQAKENGEAAMATFNQTLDDIGAAVAAQVTSTREMADLSQLLVIVVSAAAVLLSVVLAFVITRSITHPLLFLTNFFAELKTGNLDIDAKTRETAKELAKRPNEVGTMVAGFDQFLHETLLPASEALETIASGDLTVQVQKASEADTLGNALDDMVTSLNTTLQGIEASSNQVAMGSAQMADAAQNLAQGAAEQAATVEELSATLGEIAENSKANAQLSTEARELGETIRKSADTGSSMMSDMMQAVREINESSVSIGKVIELIDDIAFQTNILSLNAAVEAARAGQHGKGFAVVADEVRNLATRSAEAAAKTSQMIAASIEKAELGAHLSEETAASLGDIVNGVVQSTELIGKISVSSDAQSAAIVQLRQGVEQVADVVQLNSAMAQQSAASSQEMSSQADLLRQMIDTFKINTVPTQPGPAPKALPGDGGKADAGLDMASGF